MNIIWSGIILLSVLTAFFTGNTAKISQDMLTGVEEAVTLTIKLLGMFCFWGGITNIAEKAGITKTIAKLLSPLLDRLFNKVDAQTKEYISLSITADMLGIGNAATPLGIRAMNSFGKNPLRPDTATNNMVIFVVMNTASIRIIPTTVAMIRTQYGSQTPFDILPATLIASACAMTVGLLLAKALGGKDYE